MFKPEETLASSGLSIGAVSQLTGIPAPTLRTWEMRYGVPRTTRTAGGQRVYDPEVVDFLGLVQRAMDQGLRPAQALGMSMDELRGVLGVSSRPSGWLEAARALDGEALHRLMVRDYSRLGGHRFVTERAVPFLASLGEAWAGGELGVHHEHLASARLSSFVGERWREISASGEGRPVVLLCLPGEVHTLGLELAALVAACAGRKVILLGSLPPQSAREAVQSTDASAVLVSVSAPRSARGLEDLDELMAAIGGLVPVYAGGAGLEGHGGVRVLSDFEALADALRGR